MKKLLLSLSILLLFGSFSFSQTTLTPGDVAILGFNYDDPDEWSFAPLVDLEPNTEIKFTDNGWLASGGFRSNEGVVTWTAPATGVTKGTVIIINNDGGWASTIGSVSASGSLSLSGGGDQIIVYQGDDGTPSVVFALNSEGTGWQTDATSSNTSALPTGLTNGTNAIALNEIDNAVYDMSLTSGTQEELLAAICNPSNWTGDNANRQTMPTTNLTVTSKDDTPPKWAAGYPTAIGRDVNAVVRVMTDEPGMAYAIAVASGADAPTSGQVKAGADYGSVTVLSSGNTPVTDNEHVFQINLTGLSPETNYDVWVVAEDDESTPNLQAQPVKIAISTTATRELTMTLPKDKDTLYVNGNLHFEWTSKNIDSLYMGGGQAGHFFIITGENDQPIAVDASLGSYDFKIPYNAEPGMYDLVLIDAADTSFKSNTADSLTLIDARVLEWVSPQDGDTVYTGDTLKLVWHAEYIDSVFFGGYDYTNEENFMIEDEEGNPMVFPASPDSMDFPIPLDTETDSVRFIIYDAAILDPDYDSDRELSDTIDPIIIVDTIAPKIVELTPSNGAGDIPYTFTAVIRFSEMVNILSGNITLHKDDGTVVKTYDLTGTGIEHDDEMISFPLDIMLEKGTGYYFTMDAGAVEDVQHNPFPGITDPNTWHFTTAAQQLYISEYVEGSSRNKALEIYNPTDATVDLSKYAFLSSYNGQGWDYPPYVLHGTLAPGEVYTIVNPDFDFNMLADSAAVVDTLIGQYLTWFTGDDARGLVQLIGGSWDENPNYTLIDIIGDPDNDPGYGWDVAGVDSATYDHTLIRKSSVKTGNITIGWEASAGTDEQNSEWIVMPKNFVDNLGYPTPNASNNTTIVSFELRDTLGILVSSAVTIDSANATVTAEVIYSAGAMIDSLVPVITVAEGGSADINGDTVDFTNPVTFTVTAADGLATRKWTVTVTAASEPSKAADITSFSIEGSTGDAVIDADNHTITVEMPYGTDITALAPVFEVSPGATADPASGTTLDFTDPVAINVTAEDGTTLVKWIVTVTVFEPPVVGIYDIQYTTDASGDSPYTGQMVKTSGIVTAVNIYQDDFKGYFLQDSAKAWNGIYVYDPGRDTIEVGDSITLVGTVTEYYGLTEIKNVLDLMIVSHGNPLPGPVPLTTGEASQEMWESVFVTFHNAVCLDNNLGHGEVSVNDGSDTLIVDDYLYQYNLDDFVPGNAYDLTGVMNYSFGAFKLNPRSADDISDVTGISNTFAEENIQVWPNPSDGNFTVTVEGMSGDKIRFTILNITGKVILSREAGGSNFIREAFNLSHVSSGLYFIRIDNGKEMTVKRIVLR